MKIENRIYTTSEQIQSKLFELSQLNTGDVILTDEPITKELITAGMITLNSDSEVVYVDTDVLQLEVGDRLIAVDPCTMTSSNEDALTCGEAYSITGFSYSDDFLALHITDDQEEDHLFVFKDFYEFFKLPENRC